jgi:hypothetical protein
VNAKKIVVALALTATAVVLVGGTASAQDAGKSSAQDAGKSDGDLVSRVGELELDLAALVPGFDRD